MGKKIRYSFVVMWMICSMICYENLQAQNLLNTSTWTPGSGSAPGFNRNGSTSENFREFGSGPHGNSVLLWKAVPDNASGADGGWNTDYHAIDHTKTYRFVVWFKKTNSNTGSTYLGCTSYTSGAHQILRLNETVNTNPYFWVGDLPQLNKWYMVVGYVHGSAYNSTVSHGGIYDPVTGNKVANTTDFKFTTSATNLRHRAYLYYDTNTSDRQFFWEPRIDLVDGDEPTVQELLQPGGVDTNLLDPSTWTVGSGSVSGFGQNGSTAENSREIGKNNVGENVVLWKASPDAASGADGGWNSSYVSINHNTTYRFSVWFKKTNSKTGSSYLGLNSVNNVLRLNGTVNNNPYFWVGDPPILDRWYLVVGFAHKSSYSSTVNQGRIYDGVTGQEVATITDYKFKNTATTVRHRAYLYYDTNTADRQYFWEPRIDPVTGNEPTINELLNLSPDPRLIMSFDAAGNQSQRFFCEENGFCSPTAPQDRSENVEENPIYVEGDIALAPNPVEDELDAEVSYSIYPNRTDGDVSIKLSGDQYELTGSVSIFSVNGELVDKILIDQPTSALDFNLSDRPSGVYFIHMHFSDGNAATERIIKK